MSERKYQVTLQMAGAEKAERYFDSFEEMKTFVNDFENDMHKKGITFQEQFDHPVFISFTMHKNNERVGSLTVYK